MVTFSELYTEVDAFYAKHGEKTPGGNTALKADLLKLVQKAVEHGEGKDQSKIGGIVTTALQMFLGKKG